MAEKMHIVKLVRTKRQENEGVLFGKRKGQPKLTVGDLTTWNNQYWKVFAISPGGLLTLQNTSQGQVPASIVVSPSQAQEQEIVPLIRVIKT